LLFQDYPLLINIPRVSGDYLYIKIDAVTTSFFSLDFVPVGMQPWLTLQHTACYLFLPIHQR
jgi:hypothetical protein